MQQELSLITRDVRPLKIPELFQQILEFVEPEDLNSLSLVCQSWTGAAIDAKWRKSLVKLSRLLSQLCAHNQSCRMQELDLIHGKEALDWQTFDRHSRKITAIHVDVAIGSISTQVIRDHLEGSLCSNLITLKIDPAGTCDKHETKDLWLKTLCFFETKQLRSIEVGGLAEDPEIQAISDAVLAHDSAKLESLKIYINDEVTGSIILASQPQGEASHLETLDLTVHNGFVLDDVIDDMQFSSLLHLTLSNPNHGIVVGNLDLSQMFRLMPHLRSFSIIDNIRPMDPHWEVIMDSITPWSLLGISPNAQNLERLCVMLQDSNIRYGRKRNPSTGKQLPALKHLTF
ncbi:hypothetical protein FRB95_003789 [Tulasnella sp. JGI-2019a]|nr:hypothetical protein FRB95_003789 [Tulasnella sp. JGI-2019a]